MSPPVSSTHWKAIDQGICAKASVSIARYTPDSRTQNQPKTHAASPARNGANDQCRLHGGGQPLRGQRRAVRPEAEIGGVTERGQTARAPS